MEVKCGNCTAVLRVAIIREGTKCPKCGKPLDVPQSAGSHSDSSALASARLHKLMRSDAPSKPINRRKLVKRLFTTGVVVAIIALCVFSATREPIAPMPAGGFISFGYADKDGHYATRTMRDGQGNIIRVERVYVGDRGDVEGVLKQIVYGIPTRGGASRPMIAYEFKNQSVTKYSRNGERTLSFAEFIGERNTNKFNTVPEFEINVSGQLLAWGIDKEGNQYSYVGYGPRLTHTVNGTYRKTISGSSNWLVNTVIWSRDRWILLTVVAVILAGVGFWGKRRRRIKKEGLPNQASHATSEPAPGADSSAREG